MMKTDLNQENTVSGNPPAPRPTPSLTPDELAQLSDPDQQAEFRREYFAQLRRQACPGCGESDDVF